MSAATSPRNAGNPLPAVGGPAKTAFAGVGPPKDMPGLRETCEYGTTPTAREGFRAVPFLMMVVPSTGVEAVLLNIGFGAVPQLPTPTPVPALSTPLLLIVPLLMLIPWPAVNEF